MPDAFDPYYLWLGIPPEEQPPNHYRLLTVKLFESNPDVIAGAADRQMAHVRSFHSGKHAAESQKLLNDLSAARLCLLSADKKSHYDQSLKAKLARQQAASAPPPAPAAAAAAPKPLRVAQAKPMPATATTENALGFDPLAQTASPRHRSRRSTAQQPTLLIGAGAALLAVVGVVWLMAGGSGQPDKPPAKPIAAVDRPTRGNDWDTAEAEASDREARPTGDKPRRDDEPKRKPGTLDNSSDDAADNAESAMSDDQVSGNTTDEMPVDDSADDDPELSESSGAAAEDAPAREAVPDAAAVKTATADIQKLFKDDFTAAKKSDQKAALAKKLLALAGDSSTPLERFALLNDAKRLAISAADLGLAMLAIDALATQFELDRFTLAAEMAESLASKELPAPARQALVEAVAPLVDEAVAAGQIAAARRLATVGLAAARKGNQVEIAKVLVRQLHDLAAQEKLAEAAEAAREQLKSKPDDADAHLALGKYLCLVVGDWDAGLQHLKHGSDASLRNIAERELDGAESATNRMKLGDQWWDLSDDQKGADKDRYRTRAGYWYEQAIGELSGLSKTKVEKRLADMPASAKTAEAKPSPSKQSNRIAVGKWVDLLPLVDPAKQGLEAAGRAPDGFRVDRPKQPIQLPLGIKGDYALHVEFTRLAGGEHVAIVLPALSKQFMLALSLDNGGMSGLEIINGQLFGQSPATIRPGTLENGHRYNLDLSVRQRNAQLSIETKLDDKPYVHWTGEVESLSLWREWNIPRPDVIALAANDPTVFHVAKFKLLSGTATIDADAIAANAPATNSHGTARPEKGTTDLLRGAVLVATFDEPTIVRENGEVRVRDLSGKQQPGLLDGGTLVKGKAGRALSLTKTGDHVDFGNAPGRDLATAFTVCAWVNLQNGEGKIVGDDSWENFVPRGFVLRVSKGMPNLTIGNGNWRTAIASEAPPVGQWFHLAATHDSRLLTLYIDGMAAAQAAAEGPMSAPIAPVHIGYCSNNNSPDNQILGMIDEVALFDRALSPKEVQQIYQLGQKGKSLGSAKGDATPRRAQESSQIKSLPSHEPAKTAGPAKDSGDLFKGAVLIATFDEPTIVRKGGEVRVRDLSGKQKPGLVEGAGFAPGKSGRALEFQKVGNHVDFGDDPSLNPPALTACVWIKPSAHDNQWADILCKYHGDNGHSGFVLRLDRNTPDLTIGVGDGVWRELPAKLDVPQGEWTHIAATYDDKTQDLYINGHPAVSRPASGAALTSPSRCYIGMSDQYPGRQFFGLIDEVALFDRALSPEEIQQIYQLGATGKSLASARPALKPSAATDEDRPAPPATAEAKPPKSPSGASAALPAGAKLYLSFANDTTSTAGDSIRVNDLSGRSNGATSAGAAALVKGKAGQAVALNGGELRITPLLNGLSNFTVCAWVCLTGDEEFIVLEEGNPGGPGARVLISPSREIGLELWNFNGPPDNWLRSHTKADVVPTGKWFHIAVRLVDGAAIKGKAIVTINGKSLELPAQSVKGHPSTFARIGGAGSAMVDEVAVFDRALTDAETNAIYQTGLKQKMLVPAK